MSIQEHSLDVLNDINNSFFEVESELIFSFKRRNSKKNWKSLQYNKTH